MHVLAAGRLVKSLRAAPRRTLTVQHVLISQARGAYFSGHTHVLDYRLLRSCGGLPTLPACISRGSLSTARQCLASHKNLSYRMQYPTCNVSVVGSLRQ
jgi:hypothetical protein